MYRQYEDPRNLEKLLAKAEAELEAAKDGGATDEELMWHVLEVEELKDRVRFAWDDEMYDDTCEW